MDLSVCSSVPRAMSSVEPVSSPAPPLGTGQTLYPVVLVRPALSNANLSEFVHNFSGKVLHFNIEF